MTKPLAPLNGLKWNIDKLNTLLDSTDGTVSGSGVTASKSILVPQKDTFTFTAQSVTVVDTGGANGAQGNLKFYTFPAANVVILGAVSNLTIARVGTAITATAAVVGSVGTVAAATDNSTLTSTEANVIPSTVSTLTAGAGVTKGESTSSITVDGTSSAVELYLNFAVPDAGVTGNDALLVNGTIEVTYLVLMDN